MTEISNKIKEEMDRVTESESSQVQSNNKILETEQKEGLTLARISPKQATIVLPGMIQIRGGNFVMGSNETAIERPKHDVHVGDFCIGKLQVSFEEYDMYCDVTGIQKPDDKGWGRGEHPVINITWLESIAYCNWLSEQNGLELVYRTDSLGMTEILETDGYRLPTEAEWEYAARGGKQNKGYRYSGSDDIDEVCWYANNADNHTHPVGEKNSNELGIHDMSGNVWEWCADINHNNYIGAPADGKAWLISGEEKRRVVRGGYWGSFPIDCRITARCDWREDEFDWDLGFRVACKKV